MVDSLKFDENSFMTLITELMSYSEKLQNNPPEFVPQEELPASAVCRFLKPYTQPNGPLVVRKVSYKPCRTNLLVEYNPENKNKIVSFVGSHFDVVPANPEEWSINPFELTRDGEKLSGRGITDCLGHVAMISELFKELAEKKPLLNIGVKALFIASEENSAIAGIGIEEMEKNGELDSFKQGPLIWVDSANFGPTLGTAGALQWEIMVKGKLFHSGLPHKAINSIELAGETIKYLQKRFHNDYAANENEKNYKFVIGSSLKPTQISVPKGGLNQIPGSCTIQGDIRITPFHDAKEVMNRVEQYISELDVTSLESFGYSKFTLPDEDMKGIVTLKWLCEPYPGIACDLTSIGHKALKEAVLKVMGRDSSFSLTGSLPLVGDLKKSGFDVQICGFGRMDAYHAIDEYGYLNEFSKGFDVLNQVIGYVSENI